MKKLFALIIVVSMVITMSSMVFAETPETELSALASADFDTSNGLDTYNSDGTINITVSLGDVAIPETVDGITAFIFEIIYDKDMVAPAENGEVDSDGDSFDYTSLIDNAPDGWECFGKIDSQNGSFELALWDVTTLNPICEADALTITVPFSVKPEAKVEDISFSFKNGQIHDVDLMVSASVEISGFSVEYALQPDVISDYPEEAISIDIAGYSDAENNVIFYAENDITVADYVASYIDDEEASKGMNDFAIIIINNENGKVTYVNTDISGEESDKSEVVIPAGHYVIGVNGNNTEDYTALCEFAIVDYNIDLYNLNVEITGNFNPAIELSNVAFILYDPIPTPKQDANLVYDVDSAIITVYETELDIEEFNAMFKRDVTVIDQDGNEVTSGYVTNGMKIDYEDGVTIVMLGDVHSDGKIDSFDYILIKRHCLNTFEPTELQLLAARVAGNEEISVYDYLFLKRICLGTLKLSNLM